MQFLKFPTRPPRLRGVWMGLALTPVLVLLTALLVSSVGGGVSATAGPAATTDAVEPNRVKEYSAKAVRQGRAFWTEERMREAEPYPLQTRYKDAAAPTAGSDFVGTPGRVAGSVPGGARMATPQMVGQPMAEPQHAAYPAPHDTLDYAPRYRKYPVSTVGKVFFLQDDDANGFYSSFVCSAAVVYIGGSTPRHVVSAGHCVHNGLNGAGAGGGWSANWEFCPSYDASQGGSNPAVGCWTAYILGVDGDWFCCSDFDNDYGGAAMPQQGTVHNNWVGNVTGELGRAWNFNDEHFWSWGYPQAPPYTGGFLVLNTAEHAYSANQGVGPDSKYTGSEMTGGSSGGPWMFDFDYTVAFWDGLNSHKRCTMPGCPPGSVLTLEMGSPNATTAPGGTEDFFAFFAPY